MNVTEELTVVLQDAGAVLVGIADMSMIEGCGYSRGVAVAVPVPASIVESLKTAPTLAYYHTYDKLNRKLDEIVTAGEIFLTNHGYRAMARTKAVAAIDANDCTTLPHKTVATLAGLGWIGKSNLLVTPRYGSAVRISALLTDAPLETNAPILESQCGACALCVHACPAQALKDTIWHAGMERESIVDVKRCKASMLQITEREFGIRTDICGKCFAVCAYTQKYLNRELHNA
ncbi:MAG: epoxyqueuosine reductase [Clostridia bacterium]|nr:epoxyqueuosine reductase [Clostridia bacterium]